MSDSIKHSLGDLKSRRLQGPREKYWPTQSCTRGHPSKVYLGRLVAKTNYCCLSWVSMTCKNKAVKNVSCSSTAINMISRQPVLKMVEGVWLFTPVGDGQIKQESAGGGGNINGVNMEESDRRRHASGQKKDERGKQRKRGSGEIRLECLTRERNGKNVF